MATSIVETITPAKAQEYLNASGGNRNISQSVVDSYAITMRQGKWLLNGEAIVFDYKGKLLNGHHRLHAVIKAGVPIQTFVVRGVESESYTTFDCGRHRTVGQLIGMRGVKNYNTVASAIQVSFKLSNNSEGFNHAGVDKKYGKTNTRMIEIFDKDIELFMDAGNFAVEVFGKCGILDKSFIGGIFHYLVRNCHYDVECVKYFFENICSYDTCENNTLNMMRKKLLENKASNTAKTPRTVIMALLIKTWNNYVTGLDRKILRFDTEREDFPQFIKNEELKKKTSTSKRLLQHIA